MKYSIVTRIYTEILINQAVDNFTSSRFRESRLKGAYIPVGRSTADMLDDVLQDTDMFGDSKDEA